MNHLGVDIYNHNRATRRFSVASDVALPVTAPVQCPFCTAQVLATDGRIKMHLEYMGFSICPVSGFSLEAAQVQAQSLLNGGEE